MMATSASKRLSTSSAFGYCFNHHHHHHHHCPANKNNIARRLFLRFFHIYPTTTTVSAAAPAAARHVKIVEVGPRDGLQNEPAANGVVVSVDDKIRLITMLAAAGCQYIEAASFVSPKWVPSMANSFQVMQGLLLETCLKTEHHHHNEKSGNNNYDKQNEKKKKQLVLSCLVPNMQGLEQAIQAGADEIAIFASASEAFSQKNINCSIEESMERFRQVTQMATTHSIPIRGYISCVVACPYQGPILPSQVAKVLEYMMMHLNCHEISLGDTIGVATPASTIAMLEAAQAVVGSNGDSSSTATTRTKLAVHFHDTYGQALANILVSLERGIDTIDSSVAGLGGCPYAKGASGNVATEDVLYMLQGLGVETGIDLDKMVDAAEFITGVLGRPSRSRAGLAIAAKRQGNKAAIT